MSSLPAGVVEQMVRAALDAPAELKAERRWVLWRYEEVKDRPKPAKIPYGPSERRAKSNDPATWCGYAEALDRYLEADGRYQGIGFMLGDGWIGIDLDNCIDAKTGEPQHWAQEIIDGFARYTELSPSQTGVHIVCRGELPKGSRHKVTGPVEGSAIEAYGDGRYFTWTGANWFGHHGVEPNEKAVTWLADRYLGEKPVEKTEEPEPVVTALSDHEVLERVYQSRYAKDFHRLTMGEYRDKNTASGDDFALACHLANVTRDAAQIERLMRQTELGRQKWDRRFSSANPETYIEHTIKRALLATKHTAQALAPEEADDPLEVSLQELAENPELLEVPTPLSRWLAWRRNVTLLWGREKDAGKSTFATSDAAHAAEKGLTVFWLTADEDPAHVVRRFARLKAPLYRIKVNRRPPRSWADVEAALDRVQPDVVYVDALASFLTTVEGDVPEHSAGERWHHLVLRFGAWARERNLGVVILHHETKGTGEARGSTGIRGAVDMGIRLAPSQSSKTAREVARLGRWSLPSLLVQYRGDDVGYEEIADAAAFQKIVAEEQSVRTEVERYVAANRGQTKTEIREGVGRRRDAVYAALEELAEAEVLVRQVDDKGTERWYPADM